MNDDERYILGSSVAGLICAAAHWWPLTDMASAWHAPKRLTAYVVGGSAVLAGSGVAWGWRFMLTLAGIFAGAGVATAGAYLVDRHLNERQRRRRTHGYVR